MPKMIIPTKPEIEKWINIWNSNEEYQHNSSSVANLFKTFPKNNNVDEVMAKLAALDSLYTTHAKYLFYMAKNITLIENVDERINSGDLTVVNEIANFQYIDDNKEGNRNQYSLATKFCSFSNPKVYSIYDKWVKEVLVDLYETDPYLDLTTLSSKKRTNLRKLLESKDYLVFDKIMQCFREKYSDVFEGMPKMELDKYLWLAGKTTFGG